MHGEQEQVHDHVIIRHRSSDIDHQTSTRITHESSDIDHQTSIDSIIGDRSTRTPGIGHQPASHLVAVDRVILGSDLTDPVLEAHAQRRTLRRLAPCVTASNAHPTHLSARKQFGASVAVCTRTPQSNVGTHHDAETGSGCTGSSGLRTDRAAAGRRTAAHSPESRSQPRPTRTTASGSETDAEMSEPDSEQGVRTLNAAEQSASGRVGAWEMSRTSAWRRRAAGCSQRGRRDGCAPVGGGVRGWQQAHASGSDCTLSIDSDSEPVARGPRTPEDGAGSKRDEDLEGLAAGRRGQGS